MTRVVRGRLSSPADAPAFGESNAEVARLGGVVVELILSGDWIFLPAHVPHRVVATQPGTRWLALHAWE